VVFLVRKGSYSTFTIVNIRKIWERKAKIRKTWSMTTKKRSSEILAGKMGKNVVQKSWLAKKCSVPPNSAPGLRHCDTHSDNQQGKWDMFGEIVLGKCPGRKLSGASGGNVLGGISGGDVRVPSRNGIREIWSPYISAIFHSA